MKKNDPFSIRLTNAERAKLEADAKANSMKLTEYVRARLFEEGELPVSGMTKAEENNLKMTARSFILLSKLVKAMGKPELINESKIDSEAWFQEKYVKKVKR